VERIEAGDMDAWRGHPVTAAILREIQARRQSAIDATVRAARTGTVSVATDYAGRVFGYEDVIALFNAKGRADGEEG